MIKKDFVHLHVHSHYSLLDGLSKVPEIVAKAKEQGSPAVALTDHGVMYGAIEFYKAAKKADIKPIIGCEIYLTKKDVDGLPSVSGKKDYYHLTLLAKNEQGYKNLIQLTTYAHLEGYYYKPRVSHEILAKYREGIICLSGCLRGELAETILLGDEKKIKEAVMWYKEVFGEDFYLELQHHPTLEKQQKVNEGLLKISKESNLPLVATTDSHYLCSDDAEAQDALLCVQTGSLVSDQDRLNMMGVDLSLAEPDEMIKHFAHIQNATLNTIKIADKVNLDLKLGGMILPKFETPNGMSLEAYFKVKVKEGVKKRYGADHPSREILERVEYEASVIEKMGYESYFLIVSDFVVWAKNQGIIVGPGRGSAAGSIIAYALEITNLDPLKYDLLFERFLNPDRISMPDIDLDFQDDRRGEVIQYVVERYGSDRVAQIITFGTMAARAAVRDVGRVLGFPYGDIDKIAKLVPLPVQGKHVPLAKSVQESSDLSQLYKNDEQAKKVIDLAIKLEGTVRHASTHAAGVVISDKPLTEYVPLQKATKGDLSVVTQYSMNPLEDIGLLKMDFLGLKNLTVIKNALRIIRKTRDEEIDIDNIPLEDSKTFKLLAAGKTVGVFQLESTGMQRYLKELAPTKLGDIVALVALYRPGPMQFADDFIARKNGQKPITYLHPKLKPILTDTYGIAVFQEQVMQISRDLCGFSQGEADVLRKAMGKKIPELLQEQKKKFIEGGVKEGLERRLAEKLFEFIEPFALYGFNRAHSACYGYIAYQTAYLKANYTEEFLASLLTADHGDLDKVAKNITDAESFGIKVLPPDVNESFEDFGVVKGTKSIRFALSAIKNVGEGVAEMIVNERKEGGPYLSLKDFLTRLGREVLNKKVIESLVKAGAFDTLASRNQSIGNLENILTFIEQARNNGDVNQTDLFGDSKEDMSPQLVLKKTELISKNQILSWEKEMLGSFISEHPIKGVADKLPGDAVPLGELTSEMDGQNLKVAGIISKVQRINTKKGEPMAFIKLEDLTGSIEVIVFPKILADDKEFWQEDKVAIIEGRINVKDTLDELGNLVGTEAKIIVEKKYSLEEAKEVSGQQKFYLEIPEGTSREEMERIKNILLENKGETSVVIGLHQGGELKRMNTNYKVNLSSRLREGLSGVLSVIPN